MAEGSRQSIISIFARHKVAATLLMLVAFSLGIWSLFSLNTQFLPRFGLNIVTVSVAWPGASPRDAEQAITGPIEASLNSLDDVKKMTSVSSQGMSLVIVEFKQNVKMFMALSQVKNQVDMVRNLPKDALKPTIKALPLFEPVARVLITSKDDIRALRHYAYRFERQLIDKGIAKIGIHGLPKQEIAISLTPLQLAGLRESIKSLGQKIQARSQRVSAGVIGEDAGGRQLRTDQEKRSPLDFASVPIVTGDSTLLMKLYDLAQVRWGHADYPKLIYYRGEPAVSMVLYRVQSENALSSAKALYQWEHKIKQQLPKGMHVHVYDELWQLIQGRIDLLLKNGLGGLLLIFSLLYLFLNVRSAFWVAMGIPISLAAALFVLKLMGGTINMISLFAMIMSLGIIVDDTIVVAEQGITEFQSGVPALEAVILGAKKMVVPILASSLTTMAAFLPLLLLGGIFGAVLISIPRVVICVIIASLIECFFILPHHLKRGLEKVNPDQGLLIQRRFSSWFDRLRFVHFKRFSAVAIRHHWVTLSLALASFVVVIGVLMQGYVDFNFFPTPPGKHIFAEVTFSAGTSTDLMKKTLLDIEHEAWQTNSDFKPQYGNVVKHVVLFTHDSADRASAGLARSMVRRGSLAVELISPEDTELTNQEFISHWRALVQLPPQVESFSIRALRAGPPGYDIDIGLSGQKPTQLKQAAIELANKLSAFKGVDNVMDNLPYAQSEYIFHLKPSAKAIGLTVSQVARQLQAAYTGYSLQVFNQGQDEVEVRARLDSNTRYHLASLEMMPIMTHSGEVLPLRSVVEIKKQKSFDLLQHLDGQLTVNVTAEVDSSVANTNKIIKSLKSSFLGQLEQRYSVQYTMKGISSEQASTLLEMKYAVFLALGLIYLILAWVSSSYVWPLFVMLAIPFGLEGAIWGHLLMREDLTLLSLFGFFGLTGIVINDSIILLMRYNEILLSGMSCIDAVIEASCQRFRAVVLTSLTTIAGLFPLLFERSMQAHFLIPMAISICFGLAFSTVLILIVIPAAIVAYDSLRCGLQSTRKT